MRGIISWAARRLKTPRTELTTALAFDVSAATTTVYINVSGYQSKV